MKDVARIVFEKSHPKPVDFPQDAYESAAKDVNQVAAQYGYRLAGIRLKRAVFTTKPRVPEARNPQGDVP